MNRKPRIYRQWDAQQGVMRWTCSEPPRSPWLGGIQAPHLHLWRAAIGFVAARNAQETAR